MNTAFLRLTNGLALLWEKVPETNVAALVAAAAAELNGAGGRLCAWFGIEEPAGIRIVALIAHDAEQALAVGRSAPFRHPYPALTVHCPPAHLFEREVWEQHRIEPEGHPWLKPVRRYGSAGPAVGDFFQVKGSEIHEVAVGPVHAGVIEPGHFRFQCAGEEVLHLEIALGYQHRGVERLLRGGPHRATMSQMETVAGDSTIAHATAYVSVLEALGGREAPLRAQWLRALALELERLANHTGDLGALANDVAFLPTSAVCGKLRGDFLNLTALLCGNRFGRGLVRPGGCRHDLSPETSAQLAAGVREVMAQLDQAAGWLWDANAVRARFEGTGVVPVTVALEAGLVGLAARASGAARDVRTDHPAGWHRFSHIPITVCASGDVFARARARWLEAQKSAAYILEQISSPPGGKAQMTPGRLAENMLAASLVEGWRGETCHIALTDANGSFRAYKIVDPSFHNWTGLAMALRGQAISDFPLCNKSFNLSYCGFDL